MKTRFSPLSQSALVAAAVLTGAALSHATDLYWTGDAGNGDFANDMNWNNGNDGTSPGADSNPSASPPFYSEDIATIDTSGSVNINNDPIFRTLNLLDGSLQLAAGKTATIFNSNFAGGTLTLNAGAVWALAESITEGEPPATVKPSTLFNGGSLKLIGGTSSAKTKFAAPITSYRDLSTVDPEITNPGWAQGAVYVPQGSLTFKDGFSEISGKVDFAGAVTFDNANVTSTHTGNFILYGGSTLAMEDSTLIVAKYFKFGTDNGVGNPAGNTITLTNSRIEAGDRVYLLADNASGTIILNDSIIQSTYRYIIGYGGNGGITVEMDLNGTSGIKKTATGADDIIIGNGAGADVTVNVRGNSYIAGEREIYIGTSNGPAPGSDATVNLYDNARLGNYEGITNAQLRVGTQATMADGKVSVPNKGTLNLKSSGAVVSVVNAEVGYNGGQGTINLSPGSRFETTNGVLRLGLQGGSGTLIADGATVSITGGQTEIGKYGRDSQRSTGYLELKNGATLTTTNNVRLGFNSGDGTFIATNSTVNITGELQIGFAENMALDGESGTGVAELRGTTTVTTTGSTHVAINHSTGSLLLTDTASLSATSMAVGFRVAGVGTLELRDNSKINASGDVNIGYEGGSGTLKMSGTPTYTIGGTFTVGRHGTDTGDGTLIMTGGTLNANGTMEVARDGTGTVANLNLSGGSVINVGGRFIFGSGNRSTAAMTLSGTSKLNLNADQDHIFGRLGDAIAATMTIADSAKVDSKGRFRLLNGVNTLTVGGTDARLTIDKDFQINDGTGGFDTVNVNDGGTVTVGTQFRLGANTNAGIVVNVNAGAITADEVIVSDWYSNSVQDKKTLNVTNSGTVGATSDFIVSRQGSQDGIVNINSGGAVTVGRDFLVGHNYLGSTNWAENDSPTYTVGTVNIGTVGGTDTASLTAQNIILGSYDAQGVVNVSGAGHLGATGAFIVGREGDGTLVVNDTATVAAAANLYLGGTGDSLPNRFDRTPSGTLTVNGGTVDISSGKVILGTGTGYAAGEQIYKAADNTYTLTPTTWNDDGDDGTTPEVPHYVTWNDDNNNETPEVPALTGATNASGSVALNGGVVITQGFVKSAGAASASINLDGGTLQATAANGNFFENFAANEVIIGESGAVFNIGTNNVGIQGGFTGTGDITVTGTGTLALEGDLSGWTGAIDAAAGNVEIASDIVLAFVLDGAKASAIAVDAENAYAGVGNIGFSGEVTLNIVLANPAGITANGTYVYNVFTGSTLPVGNVTVNGTADANYSFTYIGNGQVQLTVTGVPEPGTYALLGGGVLLGLALRRRRKA